MVDMPLWQIGLLVLASLIVWLLLAVLALMVVHGASVLRAESRRPGGVRRGNLPGSWPLFSFRSDHSAGRRPRVQRVFRDSARRTRR